MASIGKDIKHAVELLTQGELVAIPTETVYGLAGNALDAKAVAKIFEVKERPTFDPLIVHVADIAQAQRYTKKFPTQASALAERFWPGPLTLLLQKKEIIPDLVTSGLDTVGIRCPDHALTRQLLSSIEFPLAAPSANPFGYVSPTRPEHVNDQLGKRISYILDGGPCTVGIESTIVGFEDQQPVNYRMGGLSVEAIESVVGTVTVKLHSSSQPQAPGQLKSHYAPRKEIKVGDIRELLANAPKKTGVLSYQTNFDVAYQRVLSPAGDLSEAAQNLFSALRELDQADIDLIVAEWVPDQGLGRAINDRLRRAQAKKD